jgi:hypothetical protein
MTNDINGWYVASVQAPGPRLGGVLEAYRGWTPCIEWCESTFGEWAMDHYTWRFVGEGVFEFKYAQDRTAFMLRWM